MKIQLVQSRMQEAGIEALLITNTSNVTYLSGFHGDSSYLFITPGQSYLLTDPRYTEQAKSECYNDVVVKLWINDERYSPKTYNALVKAHKITSLGFESIHLTHAEFDRIQKDITGANLIPTSGWIEELREVKNQDEIETLSRACQISDKALELTVPFIKPGISEIELTARLEYNLKTNGADDLSFKSIVLTGPRTSLLHGMPGDTKIQSGDIVLFDFGAELNGYHADMSRVFAVGSLSKELSELYDVAFDIHKAGVEAIHEGVTGDEIDKVIRKIIPNKFMLYFYPGIGHGVGLDIHEQPFIKENVTSSFKSGMVVTVEPGIYIPGLGGARVEDTVVVTKDSAEFLTHFPREIMIL